MTAVGRIVLPGDGRILRPLPNSMTVKLDEDETRPDGFALIEYQTAPGLPPNPPHLHRTFEEAWYILEGEVEFRFAGRRELARPGTFVFAPRGVPHAFTVMGDTPARWLTLFSPGRYFRMVEELLAALPPGGGPPPAARWTEILERYDSEVVPDL